MKTNISHHSWIFWILAAISALLVAGCTSGDSSSQEKEITMPEYRGRIVSADTGEGISDYYVNVSYTTHLGYSHWSSCTGFSIVKTNQDGYFTSPSFSVRIKNEKMPTGPVIDSYKAGYRADTYVKGVVPGDGSLRIQFTALPDDRDPDEIIYSMFISAGNAFSCFNGSATNTDWDIYRYIRRIYFDILELAKMSDEDARFSHRTTLSINNTRLFLVEALIKLHPKWERRFYSEYTSDEKDKMIRDYP